MYVLRSKKTGIDCGWSSNLWKTGGFEIIDDESGLPTPPKVLAAIREETGLEVQGGTPQPAAAPDPLTEPEPVGVLTPAEPAVAEQPAADAAPEGTFVTDAADPATVPTSMFAGDSDGDAEDNS